MNPRYVVIVVLAILAIGSWWILQPSGDVSERSAQGQLPGGYYLLDAMISDTDENGQLVYSLHAQRIEQNPSDNSVDLEKLRMIYTSASEQAWTIEASNGWMAGNREQLVLHGDVQISGQNQDSAQETKIITNRLIMDIKENQARTKAAVNIEINGGSLNAVGLHADFDSSKIKLLSEVRGTFAPDNL